MRSPRLLISAASALAVSGLLSLQVTAAPAAGGSGRTILAEHDMMSMPPSGGAGQGGSQMNQVAPAQGGASAQGQAGSSMGDGMAGCCGMGGMQQGSNAGSMGQTEMQPGSGAGGMCCGMGGMRTAPGAPGASGGMGMMGDNMRRMQQNQAMPGMGANGVDMMDRIDGRIAFLRAELGITDVQAPAWGRFAEALRSGRQHLLEARQQLASPAGSGTPSARLDRYERHLTERLEAVRTARTASNQLYGTLDEHQKHVADELVVPFLATF